MVFNTSSAEVLDKGLNHALHHALVKQLAYAFVGLFLASLFYKVGYDPLIKLAPQLLIFGCFLLFLVFVPKIGLARNGSHRWIGVAHLTFQPSEIVKFLVPLYFIDWVIKQKQGVTFQSFYKLIGTLAVPIILVLKEPDNGAAAIIISGLLPLFFIAKIPLKYWALPSLIIITLAVSVAYQLPYVKARIHVYLHPESDIKGKGHQAYQAKIATGSGGLFGKGPGQSLQKLTYLPEAQNDYIAAIFAEEFGFLGVFSIIVLYMIFAFAGFTIALTCPRSDGAMLAMVITFLIALQAFLNLGVVSGLLPSKGVNLPFFSGGGTSLVANMMALGILLNIGRLSDAKKNRI